MHYDYTKLKENLQLVKALLSGKYYENHFEHVLQKSHTYEPLR